MKRLESERLILRNFEPSDVDGAHTLFSDDEAMRYVGMYPPLATMEETRERVERWGRFDERLAIIKKDTGECIGYIALNPDSEEEREDTRELGFAISARHRRNGYMREAVQTVLEDLKKQGIRFVWACCFKVNAASEAFITNLGFAFQQEGSYDAENDRSYESLEFRMMLQS
ncbi:MAG: GNAT family N-acetyltransferase [Christensenellales bacterium]|jgi:ribosomal-protein-alanine N-acetyltransferase